MCVYIFIQKRIKKLVGYIYILTWRCICVVMKPAISGHCIAKCSATYHTYECYHDCREERFRDGDCDPKTQMCCCVGTQIYYKPLGWVNFYCNVKKNVEMFLGF